jgi:membrane-associated protease RseP (regulator of RpoE activity)
MRHPIILLLAAALLSAVPALADGDRARFCDDNDENCVEVPGLRVTGSGVQVLYVGDDEDAPRFVPVSRFLAPRGFLGVSLTDLTPELQRHFGVDDEIGVLVSRVEPDSPAQEAGVRVGDVITLLDGRQMRSAGDVARSVRDKEAGEAVDLEVWRDGRPLTLTATAAVREKAQWDISGITAGDVTFGVGARQIQEAMQSGMKGLEHLEQLKGPQGRYVFRVDPESAARWQESLNAYLSSQDFSEQARRLHGLEGDLAQRIRELEKRLQELEQELGEGDGER